MLNNNLVNLAVERVQRAINAETPLTPEQALSVLTTITAQMVDVHSSMFVLVGTDRITGGPVQFVVHGGDADVKVASIAIEQSSMLIREVFATETDDELE